MSEASVTPPPVKEGLNKAAILLLNLGYEHSTTLLRKMSDEQVEAIGETIAELGEITPQETQEVLEEFIRLNSHSVEGSRGGLGRARRILSAAFGQEIGRKMTEAIPSSARAGLLDLSMINAADPAVLAGLIAEENPQTIAVLLGYLQRETASAVLKELDEELRTEVTLRLAMLEGIQPEVLGHIVNVLNRKLHALGSARPESVAGARIVADLLNRVPADVADDILIKIQEEDEQTANELRNLLFVFEDLTGISADGLREMVKRIDRKVLTTALKGTSDELQSQVLETMSKRGGEMLREDMEALGPVKIKDVDAAQKEILEVVKAMEKEGVLSLSASGADEYVV